MRAGRLNKNVVIQSVTETSDSMGGITESWATFATVWASVNPISGKEYFESKQVNAELTTKIRIRYLAGVTSKMRILYDSRIFTIESVINVMESSRELILMCTEDV